MLIPGSAFRSVTRIHCLVRATLMNDKSIALLTGANRGIGLDYAVSSPPPDIW